MNLTYEIIENGYVILNDGVKWIEQTGFIPYPGATMEESAQNHIVQLLKDAETTANEISETEKIKSQLAEQEQAIAELSMFVGSLIQ